MKTLGTHNYCVYILTNKSKTVLYTGVTNNLKNRLHFHNNPEPFSKAFTTRYKCYYLLYYEHFLEIEDAIKREKEIKGWSRNKKETLICSINPEWKFLNDDI
ncbi:GIY-YIG nuclease family protein [Winogradskyella sp.]|uniref:GIY-YIG nuclease family protein n=1 Tax=Winogradskyella sp. TaxID=1883156 RepID=UPI0026096109|nr:GIY-YIG nuclease family protein [Winogradskyella sp.]